MLRDKIAGYSNYGSKVDLYAYESYSDLCPNGTSCSTPAISGAAAAVAAKYPELTPEQIKSVLLEASERRTLEVDTSTSPKPQVQLIEGGATAAVHQASGYEFHAPMVSGPDSGLEQAAHELLDSSQPGPDALTRTVNVLDPATMMPRIFEIARKRAHRH